MTADDLTRLRAITEAATPGPWYRNSGLIWGHDSAVVTDTRNLNHDDAVHIATFDPPTVAALIDRVERAERERDLLQTEVNTWIENDQISFARATRLDEEITALRAAVAGLADELHQCVRPCYCEHSKNARDQIRLLTEGADDGQ